MNQSKIHGLFVWCVVSMVLAATWPQAYGAGIPKHKRLAADPGRGGGNPVETLSRLEAVYLRRVEGELAVMPARERDEYLQYTENLGLPLGRLMVSWSRYGIVRSLNSFNMKLDTPLSGGTKPLTAALAFLSENKALFRMQDPESELVLRRQSNERNGNCHLFFRQVQEGLPVFGSDLAIHLNPDNDIIGINGLFLPIYLKNYSPRISEAQAKEIFIKHLGQEPAIPLEIDLGVFNPEAYDSSESPALVWRVTAEQFPNPVYFIDAEDGSVIHHFNHVETALDTQIWKHNDFPGSDCPGDADVYVFGTDPPYFVGSWPGTSLYVFEGTQCTYQYYLDRHGMDSWDGNGATMYACSDYGSIPTGVGGGNYGGQGPSFGGCGACPDIIGHEFTHKYMRNLTLLIGNIQTNSLRESFCDVMGEFIEDHCFGPPDWLLGTGGSFDTQLCADATHMRSLKDPPEKGHPDHWNDFDWEADIDGHVDCGIANKSAWLLGREPSEGWTAHAGVGVRGIGTHDAGDVWFNVLANWITSNAQFSEFGEAVQNAGWSLYGLSDQHTQSRRSIMAVGLWSTDSNQYFDTDSSVSLISGFTVNGEWRKYVFYKEPDNTGSPPRLCYRYRNSALYGYEPWSDEYYLALANTSQAPSAVVFEDRIWVFFVNGDDPVLRCITIDDQNKLGEFFPNGSAPSTDQSPSAVVFNDKIYVFCKSTGNDASGIQYFRYDGHWSGPHDTVFSSTDGPRAAAPLNDKLWLFWRDGGDDSIRYSAMDVIENWEAEFTVPNNAKTQDTPTVAIHRNRLHLAASGPDNGIYYTSCSLPCTQAGDWTRFVKQDYGLGRRMTLFSDIDSWLYLFHRFQTADTVAWRKKFSE